MQRPEEDDARELEEVARQEALAAHTTATHDEEPALNAGPPPEPPPAHALNDEMECPCGSGKAFRLCHGGEDEATA